MNITTNWHKNNEGNEILQVLENNKVSHYFRMSQARTDPDLWFVHKYTKSNHKPNIFIPNKKVY